MDGLEAIEDIKGFRLVAYDEDGNEENCKTLYDTYVKEEFDTIEQDLKVLNILKDKKVDLNIICHWLDCYDKTTELVNEYNYWADYEQLTEEEMQLIVEWLKKDRIG